jgi:hypothetical protein
VVDFSINWIDTEQGVLDSVFETTAIDTSI